MYTRVLFWIGIGMVISAVIFKTSLISNIILFFVFGIIPGTTLTLPFWSIMLVYPVLMIGLIYWLSSQRHLPPQPSIKVPARTSRQRKKRVVVQPVTDTGS